jgi:hypothetical protein
MVAPEGHNMVAPKGRNMLHDSTKYTCHRSLVTGHWSPKKIPPWLEGGIQTI